MNVKFILLHQYSILRLALKILSSTISLCPECLTPIDALIIEEKGKIFLKKECPIHGKYIEQYWADQQQYLRAKKYEKNGNRLTNPQTSSNKGCPYDCGICPEHKTSTILGIIDVTNRCNLNCPICFAHSGATGYIYEPSREQVKNMINTLYTNTPASPPAIQFSGGEPTLRDDLPELVKMADTKGFEYIMVNTNGLRLAKELDYCMKLKKAGVNAIYLQFDGLSDDIYQKTRGANLLKFKLKTIKNLREAGLSCVLVPVLVKGLNDYQVGDIIRYSAKNIDVIRGVNFQPVSITGRIDRKQRLDIRITLPDLMRLAEEQTGGKIKPSDWFPVPTVQPLSAFLSAVYNHCFPDFAVHTHCGVATYVVFDDGELKPITSYVKVDAFLQVLSEAREDFLKGRKNKAKLDLVKGLRGNVKLKFVPGYIHMILSSNDYLSFYKMRHENLFIGAMHFMDPYNFDIKRVQRCGIHYAVPDGRIVPFCTMNNIHRKEIEKKFAQPLKKNDKTIL
jgi:hypothetical protein